MFTEAQVNQWRSEIYALLDMPSSFAQWLAEQGNRIVGRGYHVEECPIHNFLVDQAPWLDAHVGKCRIYAELGKALCKQHGWLSSDHAWNYNSRLDYYGGYALKETPEWVSQFITVFDRKYCVEAQFCRLYDREEDSRIYKGYATGEGR